MDFRLTPELEEEVLNTIIKDFKLNYSYRLLKEIQDARINMKLYEYTKNKFDKRKVLFFKHKRFERLNTKFFIHMPLDMIKNGEREHARKLKEYKYKLIELTDFNKEFNMTVDLFHNGLKIPNHEIEILYTDYDTFLCIPNKYYDFIKLYAMVRKYQLDMTVESNKIIIPKEKYNGMYNKNFLLFSDGKYNNKYTKSFDNNGNVTITINAKPNTLNQLCFIPNFFKEMELTKENSYFKVPKDNRFKFPISTDGMIAFENGLLVDLNITPKTSNIFKIDKFTTTVSLVIFYEEFNADINSYRDKVTWYDDRADIITELNNNTQPEFITKHKLSNIDLSIASLVESKKTNLEYMKDKLDEIIQYDYDFYNYYINEVFKHVDEAFPCYDIDLSKIDLNTITRTDNRKEILVESMQIDFITKFIVIPFPNKNNYNFNLFIDGIAHFDYITYHMEDISYIYIRLSKVNQNSILQIEILRCNKDCTHKAIIPDNNKTIEIDDIKYTSCFKYIDFFYYDKDSNTHSQIDRSKYTIKKLSDEKSITTFTEPLDTKKIIKVVNNYCSKKYRYTIKQYKQDKLELFLPSEFILLNNDKNNYRIYKNGRLLPRNSYELEFPNKENKYNSIKLTVNAKFVIAEVLMIEYIPFRLLEIYNEKQIEEYGRIRLDKGVISHPINNNLISHHLNGRRLYSGKKDIKCNNGMEIFNVHTRRNYFMLLNLDLACYVERHKVAYNTGRDYFDEYIKSIMKGRKIIEEELDILDKNIDRMSDLYWDLYQEFLKHNIVDFGKDIPEYIVFKYSDLIDSENILYIKCDDEDVKYWMPLDATINYSEQHFQKIQDLYYQLMENMKELKVVNSKDIPPELYDKYRELFNNNVLVLKIPDIK